MTKRKGNSRDETNYFCVESCDMGRQFSAYKGQEGDKAGEEDRNKSLEA